MNIQKPDLKKKLMAGTLMAVMSGFVPSVVNQAHAGTATVPVHIDIVTQIVLSNTNTLDFGRLAITDTVNGITGNHTLSPAGATTTANGASVPITGSPGNFDIGVGTNAVNVTVAVGATVTYNAGKIALNRVTLDGSGLAAACTVAAGATETCTFAGGGNDAVNVGGRLALNAPARGSYNTDDITITITDIP